MLNLGVALNYLNKKGVTPLTVFLCLFIQKHSMIKNLLLLYGKWTESWTIMKAIYMYSMLIIQKY